MAGTASNSNEAYAALAEIDADLVILDIHLGDTLDGIALARAMNDGDLPGRPFIFLTSATDKATFQAAKITHPHSYLTKPFNPLELSYSIELAIEKTSDDVGQLALGGSVEYNGFFFVKQNGMLNKISPSEIAYVKVEGKYCELHSQDSRYICRKSLTALMNMLPNDFRQVHRNYLLNANHLLKIDVPDRAIYLSDKRIIPVSLKYLDDLQKDYPVLS